VWRQFNPALALILLSLFLFGFRTAAWLALILGFFADIISFNYFGLQLLTLPLVVILADLWMSNWFTNRSAYSFLALTVVATIFYNLSYYFLSYLGRFMDDSAFFIFSWDFWAALGLQVASNLTILLAYFFITSLHSRRFRPVFLEKN